MSGYISDPIYKIFVADEKDTVGLLAYAIYKTEEISYCSKSGNSYDEFVKIHTTNAEKISEYKTKSKNLVTLFGASALQESFTTITAAQTETLKKPWPAIWQNLFASFLYSVFLVLIYLIVTFGNKGWKIVPDEEQQSGSGTQTETQK